MSNIHPIALTCVALLGLLLFTLGMAVSGARGKTNILMGTAPDADAFLSRLVRAHGNTAEYAPFLAVLFLVLGSRNPSESVNWLIVGATAARFVFVVGMLTAKTLSRPSPLRFIGAAGTYFTGITLSILLLTGAN